MTSTPAQHEPALGRIAPRILVCLVFVAAALPSSLAQSGGGYDLTWSTVDGGGGRSEGGGYSLSGTIGQPDAGVATGGPYTLRGGFWSCDDGAAPSLCTLTITSSPILGIPIYGGYPGNTEYAVEMPAGTEVTLYADFYFMNLSDVYWFIEWRINGLAPPGGQGSVTFTVNEDTTAEAVYQLELVD